MNSLTKSKYASQFRKLQKGQFLSFLLQVLKAVGLSSFVTGLMGLAMLIPVIVLVGPAGGWRAALTMAAIPFAVSATGNVVLMLLVLLPTTPLLARLSIERPWKYMLLGTVGGTAIPPLFLVLMDWQVFGYWETGSAPVFAAFGGLAGAIAGYSWGSWRAELRLRPEANDLSPNPIHDLLF